MKNYIYIPSGRKGENRRHNVFTFLMKLGFIKMLTLIRVTDVGT